MLKALHQTVPLAEFLPVLKAYSIYTGSSSGILKMYASHAYKHIPDTALSRGKGRSAAFQFQNPAHLLRQ